MAFTSLCSDVIQSRMKAAQDINFELSNMCGPNSSATIDAHSKAIGAPHPFIFYPLLTVIAACMGVKASVNVNTEWTEPMILWTVVAARKGEKKTPACKRLTKAIQQLEKEMQEQITADLTKSDNKDASKDDDERQTSSISATPTSKLPQLLVHYFSFEELYQLMSRSGCQVNISTF